MTDGIASTAPGREVHRAEALGWLATHPAGPQTSVVTSLPDFSELRELAFEAWRTWFVEAAQRVVAWTPADGVAIFFQTDVRRRGVWIDKSYLVLRAGEAAGAELVWHKIVCREPPGSVGYGRARYSHLLCFSKRPGLGRVSRSADVVPDAGPKPTQKAMGIRSCELACVFARDETAARVVVDPFCGSGMVLAVANALGLDAVGVDRSARACAAARRLTLSPPGPTGGTLLGC